MPTPQEALQVAHSETWKLQLEKSIHWATPKGFSPLQSASMPVAHWTSRVRCPTPHVVLHSDQPPTPQLHESEASDAVTAAEA
jgi:hypothetical protein